MSWLTNLIGIGHATLIDDREELQRVQVTERAFGNGFADRVTDRVRRITEFGFASVPPLNSEVLMLRRGADRALSTIIGTSHRPSRPRNLKPGDTGIYDVRGARVMLTEDGLVIDCAGLPAVIRNASKLTIDVPEVEMTGALKVAGEITALTGGAPVGVGALRDKYNAHKHTGVAAGGASSGTTDQAA